MMFGNSPLQYPPRLPRLQRRLCTLPLIKPISLHDRSPTQMKILRMLGKEDVIVIEPQTHKHALWHSAMLTAIRVGQHHMIFTDLGHDAEMAFMPLQHPGNDHGNTFPVKTLQFVPAQALAGANGKMKPP